MCIPRPTPHKSLRHIKCACVVDNISSRAEVRGIPVANDLESFECVNLRIQGTRSHSTVHGDSQAGRVPGCPVLPVVIEHVGCAPGSMACGQFSLSGGYCLS